MTFVPQTQIVAAVQFEPKLLDVQGNLAAAQQLAFEAAAKGARLIVLPELCTSGYVMESMREAMTVAQTRDGYQTQAFVNIAKRFNCHIVFGYVELKEGKLYNSAAVVGPEGLVGHAQKHNCFGSDNIWAQPSEAPVPVINTPVGRLGVLICRDISNRYRESYVFHRSNQRFYRRGDVDVIACPVAWGSSFGYPDSAWVELVEETRANAIIANRVGDERDMKFKGGSAIIDRDRRIYTHGSNFTHEAIVGGIVVL